MATTRKSQLVDSLPEMFERMGRIEAKRMFGGYGIYHEDRMFGLVTHDTLYLKTDDQNRAAYEARKLLGFTYERQGKKMEMSYRQAPEEIFEDRDEAARWGREAYAAALRSGQPPKKKRAAAAKKVVPKMAAAKKVAAKKRTK